MCLLVQKPASLFGQTVHLQSWRLQRECLKYWIQTSWHLCWHQNHLHVSPKLSAVFGDAKLHSAPGATIKGLPGDMPKAGVAVGLAEAPKPKLGPEDVLAPKLKPELCIKQKPESGVTVHHLTKVLICKNKGFYMGRLRCYLRT